MSEKTGRLCGRRFHGVRGNVEHIEYTWEGPPETYLDWNFLDYDPVEGDVLQFGPYRLKVIERIYDFGGFRCIRMDYPFWRLRVYQHRASRIFNIVYQRIIMTLAVWRLADYDPAVTLSWHDIKLIKRLRGRKA